MRVSTMRLSIWMRWTVCSSLKGLMMAGALAQTVGTSGSFTDNSLDLGEAKLAIQGAVSESEDLLRQNLLLQEQVRSITETLAQSRIEADATAAENKSLKLRIEALGLDAVGGDRAKLEQRLIKALGDLRLAQKEAGDCRQVIAGLTEAVIAVLKTASGVDPETRMSLEAQLRAASEVMGYNAENIAKAGAVEPTLTGARVISIKAELGLIVGNVGSGQGVKVGMPFRVMNGDTTIALARVVDVRENICGALIQELSSEQNPVKIGHRLKVDAE